MGMMLALCPLRAPAGDLWGSLTLLLLGPCGVGVSLILGMGCFCFGDDTVRYRGWLSNLEGPLPPQVARGLVQLPALHIPGGRSRSVTPLIWASVSPAVDGTVMVPTPQNCVQIK